MHIVVSWLLQGAVMTLAAAVVLRLIARSRTRARYWTLWAAVGAVLALPIVPHLVGASVAVLPVDNAPLPPAPILSLPASWWTSTTVAIVVGIAWLGIYATRLVMAAWALRQTKRHCLDFPPELEARLLHWSALRTSGRRTRLALSPAIRSAAVLGGASPVIAVSPALLDHLSESDLDRIVVHEWAHVQRCDDVVHMIERGVRAIVGWHPGVWWIGRQLEHEREVACDEMAVAITGSPKKYATCLTTLAALPLTTHHQLLTVAALSSSRLERRLERILAPAGSARRWQVSAACGVATVIAVAAIIGHVRIGTTLAALAADTALAARVSSAIFSPLISTAARGHVPTVPERLRAFNASSPRLDFGAAPVAPTPQIAIEAGIETTHAKESEASTPTVTAAPSVLPANPLLLSTTTVARAAEHRPSANHESATPWSGAANTGVAIGRVSQNAAVKTAGAFSRFGKRIANSF